MITEQKGGGSEAKDVGTTPGQGSREGGVHRAHR